MAYKRGDFKSILDNYGTYRAFTATMVGIHPNTLGAASKEGLFIKCGTIDGRQAFRMTSKGAAFVRIEELIAGRDFITLKRPDAEIGMLCTVNGYHVLDAWGQYWEYDGNVEYMNKSREWEEVGY